MKKFRAFLLVLAVVNFVPGLLVTVDVISAGNTPGLYLLLPAAAGFFGLFMIWHMLEKGNRSLRCRASRTSIRRGPTL